MISHLLCLPCPALSPQHVSAYFVFLRLHRLLCMRGNLFVSVSFLSPNSWLRSQEEAAASRLQRWWRLWHARRVRAAVVARRAAAATAIAAAWRGFAARRRLAAFGCEGGHPSTLGVGGALSGAVGFTLASIRARVRAALSAKRAAAVVIQVRYYFHIGEPSGTKNGSKSLCFPLDNIRIVKNQ